MPFLTAWNNLLDVWAWKPGTQARNRFHAFYLYECLIINNKTMRDGYLPLKRTVGYVLLVLLLLTTSIFNKTQAQSEGVLNGIFSISDNTQVKFSRGNLQYIGSATTPYWKFAEHQWDYLGSAQNGSKHNVDRDLFGFATSGYNHGAVCYQPWSISANYNDYYPYGAYNYNLYDQTGMADWGYNAIINGCNQENQWRTLTKDEWNYLLNTRSTVSGIRYARANLNNTNGMLLFPDNWDTSIYVLNNYNSVNESNIITLSDWTNILEPSGVVFLPASGYRSGTETEDVNNYGYYWSSSAEDYGSSYMLVFGNNYFYPQGTAGRQYGYSVRLVKDCPMTIGYINVSPNPSDGGSVTGEGIYIIGETCTLIATANSKYAFINWTKNGMEVSTNPIYSFSVSENAQYLANFARTDLNEVIIGSANSYSQSMPVYNEYSLVQQVYTAEEIGMDGPIDEISFYLRDNSNTVNANIDVYLKHTTRSAFYDDNDWESIEVGDLYYSGTYTIGGTPGWKHIKLDTPFNYNGEDNLLVCINNNSGNISSYHNWNTYQTNYSRAIAVWGWYNSFDPFNPEQGSCQSYINQIKFGFLITQQTSITAAPNPINMGYRPSGAWMAPFKVNILNTGQGTVVNNISTTNPYFQLNNVNVPFYFGYNDDIEIDITTGAGDGDINSSLVINYGNQNQQEQFDLVATAYTPSIGDVWETASVLSTFPYSASVTPANTQLYDNYRLPPSNITDGPDVVYKLVVTEDTYLNASVSNGENGKVAIYSAGFDNVGGPDLDNCYYGPTIQLHEWLTYDDGTTYTNVRHNSGTTTWGYKFPVANLAEYAGTTMTKVALYSNYYTGGITTVNIYKGGYSAPETLLTTQTFNLPNDLNAYYNVTLDTPVRITGRDNIWVVFSAENNGHYPAATTDYYYDSQYNGCWWYDYDTESWIQYQYRGNWKIKAFVTSDNNRLVVDEEDKKSGNRNLITIGDGNTSNNQYLPSYSYYNFSLTQQLYTAAEIGVAGNISSVAFYNAGTEKHRSYAIYMVNTDKTVFNSSYDWIPVTEDDLVYSGIVTMLENDWTTIQFDTPFEYNGYSNLALIVKDNTGSDSYGMTCRVFTPEAYNYCSIYTYGSDNYDQYNPSMYGNRTRAKNQIQLNITPVADNEIVNMTVVPGTYYLVASSTSDSWNVDINAEAVPCPKQATNPTPSNNSTNISPTLTKLKWNFGKRTTEYMLKFGTTSECEETLVDWTRDLCNEYTLMGLSNNTQYYWKVIERNNGCQEGVESQTWTFITQLNGPYLYTNTSYMYVGDTLQLSWRPLSDTCVHSYNIYKNDTLIANCSANNNAIYYNVIGLNYNPDPGYTFKVSAVYNGGESSFYNTRNVRVSGYGSVSGHVYEQDGSTPIRNAKVVFSGQDEFNNYRSLSFNTDSTGYYNGTLYVGTYNGMASSSGYQSEYNPDVIAIVYNNHIPDIDYIMDESFAPVGDVYAQYHPDSLDTSSDNVKIYWSQKPNNIEDFESEGFTQFEWQHDATYPWQITSNNPYEGMFCMKSGNYMVPNTTSAMQITLEIPFDSYMSFFSKVSSEGGCDFGRFYIDNNQQNYWSGDSDWSEYSYYVTAGTHTFKWTYSKDGSVDNGDDCFYVDYIRFYNDGNRGEARSRSFQHYRVYRTDFYNDGPFTEDNTVLVADGVSDTLYIDDTWGNTDIGVYKYGVSKVYEGNRDVETNVRFNRDDVVLMDDFENGMNNWTTIDADGDGYNWQYNSSFGGHQGSTGIVYSASYDSNVGVLNPDNYLISPMVNLGGTFTFWACAQDANWAAEHFGVAVSTTNNTSASAFMTIQEWTMTAKGGGETSDFNRKGDRSQGTWYQYSVDLSSYAGQIGYVAIRHFNCSDMFYLNVDDVVITGPSAANIQSERESVIKWSNPLDKDMYLTNGTVNINVTLYSGDSPEGVYVTFTNLNEGEQQAHPIENNIILDASGFYAWDNFRKGNYQISIAKEGYDIVTEQVNIWDAVSLSYVLHEIYYEINNLYVSRTGWVMWRNHNNSPIPELAGDSFEFNFDNGSINGLTLIDADNDGHNWIIASDYYGGNYGYNNSNNSLVSLSFDYNYWNYYYPNNYLVFPLAKFESNSKLSFYACNPVNNGYNYNVYMSVAISLNSDTNPNDFTTIENLTINCNSDGQWKKYTIDLSNYAGQVGYIALVHNNGGNSSRNNLFIDNVVLTNNDRGEKGNRHFEHYRVVLTDANNQVIYSDTTSHCFMQLPTDDLIDGDLYHCRVVGIYNMGSSEFIETDWIYQSCDHFAKLDDIGFDMSSAGNKLSWTYPNIDINSSNVSTAFACSYNTYGSNPTSWISYSLDNPQSTTVLNNSIQVYGGDYCGADGYVHATYNNNYWYKIDPATGIIVEQGSLGRYFYDCAWDYTTSSMFGVYNEYLYLWDVEYNTTTSIGYMNNDIRVLACDVFGQLWGIAYNGGLYRIDKTTGGTTYIGSTGTYAYNGIQSAGFDHNTGKLYWAHYDGYLYEVNTETCQKTMIASNLGSQSSWCIPYTGEMSTPSGILGAVIYRDNELVGFTYGNSYTDTEATGNHLYEVRVVYEGTDKEPYWNTHYAMSCPNTVGGDSYTVNVSSNPSDGGEITGAGSYINGLQCTLTATANEGYVFANWTENDEVISNCPEYTFRVRENHNIVGNFIDYNQHWTVINNPTYYDMSLIGILQFNGFEQSADYLEVGAFCNGECRASQMLSYNSQFHRSIISMNVRGRNNDMITFKVYDHLLGEEVDLVGMNELTYAMNTVVGSFMEPYAINFGIRQSTIVQNGWNWYSTYIEQEGIDGLGMLETSLGAYGVMIKSQDDGFVINFHNIWTGSLNGINNEQMYMINTNSQTMSSIVGNRINPTSHPITLYTGWNWIANPFETPISIEDALAEFTPTDGDVIKSQQSFSTYMDGLGWFGSFNTLEPGVGLMYYSNKNTEIVLTYSDSSNQKELISNITTKNNHWIPNVYEYPFNMTLNAIVMLDNIEISSDHYELAAFVNEKCVGSSKLVYNERFNNYIAYMTIYGEDSAVIHFNLYDELTGMEYSSEEDVISFEINSIIGNVIEPYVVYFDGFTGVNPNKISSLTIYPNPVSKGEIFRIDASSDATESVTIEIVDALGSMVFAKTVNDQPISVTAPCTAGVYTIRIIIEGKVSYCRKLIVK